MRIFKTFDHDNDTTITAYQVVQSFGGQIRDHYQP